MQRDQLGAALGAGAPGPRPARGRRCGRGRGRQGGAEGFDGGLGPGHAADGDRCEAGAAEAAAAAFRGALEKMASNGALAVSELYLGCWRGRHWCGQQVFWLWHISRIPGG